MDRILSDMFEYFLEARMNTYGALYFPYWRSYWQFNRLSALNVPSAVYMLVLDELYMHVLVLDDSVTE